MRHLIAISCLLLAGPVLGDDMPWPKLPEGPKATDPGVGHHEAMSCVAKPTVTYKLYIPKAYEEQKPRRLPSVYFQNPGGSPNFKGFTDWAEQQAVILVAINRVSNGMPQHEKPPIQDAVLRDLDARGIRVHPHLRFTIGMSGGAADGQRMVRRQPERFAGLICQGAGGMIQGPNAKHLAFAFLNGAKDSITTSTYMYRNYELAQQQGNPAKIRIHPKLAHKEVPLEERQEMLAWMIALEKLIHPKLTDAERASYLEEARRRMRAVAAIADVAARLKEAERLLDLEPLRKTEEFGPLLATWLAAVQSVAQSQSGTVQRHVVLMDTLEGPLGSIIPPEQRRALEQQAAALRQEKAVADDWTFRQRYRAAVEAERRAALEADKLAEVAAMFARLASDAAGTEWAAKAAAEAASLRTGQP